ncbi:uncharacterized protein LOC144887281 isoform X2 [Branchiostoma floridae x Branchiostoma japonicum]
MLFYAGSVLLLLVLGSSTVESLSAQTCLQYVEGGNCDFYTECLEDKYSCGAKGYPVGYGHRYCNRFHTYYNDFNAEGKAWVDDVRKCLMKALVPIYKSNSYSCDEVKTLAFTSHPTCYTESGDRFCKVLWTNKLALLKVFEADDFLGEDSALAIEQILMTGLQCLCDYGLADEIHQVVDATSEVWTNVLDFTTQLWRDDPKEAIQSECEAKALQGDCDFYNCLERRHPCGLKGFASREGRPLCERLKIKKGLFNAQGQAWVNDFTKCLTRSLLPKYRDESISCRHINNYGYQAQDSCFIDNGICDLEEDKQNEFALWYISDVVEDSRFHQELSTILCRCNKYEGGSRYKLKFSFEHGIYLKQKAPVMDETSPADLPCTSQGGQCQDYTVRTCLAGYETSKCGGNALRRCCLQCDSSCQADHLRWSAGDSSCSNAGGQCKMDSNFCHGQYQTGICGGPAGRKCCVPGPGGSSSGSGNYGNIMNVDTTGASQTTASQDGLSYNGVPASQQLARNDLSRLNNYKSQIDEAAADKNMDPAVIAAIISRESRAGNQLDANGWGLGDPNGYGLMQVDKEAHPNPDLVGGPYSTEHIKQGTQILIGIINCVKRNHSDWTADMALKGGISGYNAGCGNVWTYENMDRGTTGDDYANDVVARAQWLRGQGFGQGTSASGTYSQCPEVNMVLRDGWGAREPKSITSMPTPVSQVFIHHTTGGTCSDMTSCSSKIRGHQNYHMNTNPGNNWSDIGYNFLVGEDGRVYEGRGFDRVGSHTYGYNSVSIAVSFVGDYTSRLPNQAAQDAAKAIINCGVQLGKVTSTYRLRGHRDVKDTECPGDTLYDHIKTWPHYS